MSIFRELEIAGVFSAPVRHLSDARGWLAETFRSDWLEGPGLEGVMPAMSYVSVTRPGVARGPHEHREQTDYFAFLGPSTFRVYVWDNRPGSETFGKRLVLELGEGNPGLLIVPPGVVHAYKNVGPQDGVVHNFPNRLFAGRDRKEPVDEIRHENDPNSRFRIED